MRQAVRIERSVLRKSSAAEKQKGRNDVPALREDPSQGDNPNIALTRPQIISPLTLVG